MSNLSHLYGHICLHHSAVVTESIMVLMMVGWGGGGGCGEGAGGGGGGHGHGHVRCHMPGQEANEYYLGMSFRFSI